METNIRKLSIWRRLAARTVVTVMAVLAMATLPAHADNHFYRDGGKPSLSEYPRQGAFTIEFLNYDKDYPGYQDYLKSLVVTVECGGQDVIVYQHTGAHSDMDKATFNNYHGVDYFANGASQGDITYRTDGDKYYKKVKINLPEGVWGQYKVKWSGRWYYQNETKKPSDYTAFSGTHDKTFEAGTCTFNISTAIDKVEIGPDPKTLKVSLKNIKFVDNCVTTVALKAGNKQTQAQIPATPTQTYEITLPELDVTAGTQKVDVITTVTLGTGSRSTSATVSGTAPKLPSVSKLTATYNTLARTATLQWEVKNAPAAGSSFNASIFRRKCDADGNPIGDWKSVTTLKGESAQATNPTYTDNYQKAGNSVDTKSHYKYMVAYYDTYWTGDAVAKYDWDGISTVVMSTNPELDITLDTERQPEGVLLNWHIPHSSLFNASQVTIYRYDDDGNAHAIAQVPYGNDGKGSYLDKGDDQYAPKPFAGIFKYYVVLEADDTWYASTFKSEEATGQTINAAYIKELRASKGYDSRVHLEWDVQNYRDAGATSNPTSKYTIYRRSLESDNTPYLKLYELTSNSDSHMWDDQTAQSGVYYDYKVQIEAQASDGTVFSPTSETSVGFCRATGTVAGRVTYGTGTAVADVDVVAIPNASSGSSAITKALYFANNGSTADCRLDDETNREVFNGDFSVQMWIKPLDQPLTLNAGTDDYEQDNLLSINDILYIRLKHQSDRCALHYYYHLPGTADDRYNGGGLLIDSIPVDQYSHLTIISEGRSLRAIVHQGKEIADTTGTLHYVWDGGLVRTTSANVGYDKYYGEQNHGIRLGKGYLGLIDDVRIWKRALSDAEISENYNVTLTGNEDRLFAYWTFDEGIRSEFFDYSRQGSVMNSHHGTLSPGVSSVDIVPTNEQLAYRARTDQDGNYIITGIPYSGEGTSYAVVPSLGIHDFQPYRALRYVNGSSLVHNNTDFTDISSFPVSGYVYYEGSTYPVEGCSFYVDGVQCTRENKAVASAADGSFTIDVPIGYHKITISCQGHTFADGGQYPPASSSQETLYFDHRIDNLTFTDNTLVNLTGRVTGGDIEGKKPLGFGESKNTIGQVKLTLVAVNDVPRLNAKKVQTSPTTYSYDCADEPLEVLVADEALNTVHSRSYRGGGSEEACRRIYIETDPATGEFSALVPPILYKLESARTMKKGTDVSKDVNIDLTHPTITHTDSLACDSLPTRFYNYHGSLVVTHHTPLTLDVKDTKAKPGAYGAQEVEYTDDFGSGKITDIYTYDEATGQVTYNYGTRRDGSKGVPIFVMQDAYDWEISAYERYVNEDTEAETFVPMVGTELTITNQLSDSQPVYNQPGPNGEKEGEAGESARLGAVFNQEGKIYYHWVGGLPNISDNFTRTITMSCSVGGKDYFWHEEGFEGLILGALSTGSNFVTLGPDKVNMVLRDPPGSKSSASWTSGTTTSLSSLSGSGFQGQTSANTTFMLGFENEVGSGIGLVVMSKSTSLADVTIGFSTDYKVIDNKTHAHSTTISQAITTSNSPSFVGTEGDIYIGTSTNLIFGKARQIAFQRASPNAPFDIVRRDAMLTGIDFPTTFYYTQHYIEKTLIPNYQALIDSKLHYATMAEIEAYENTTNDVVYLTPIPKTDKKHYATRNDDKTVWGNEAATDELGVGPSYWAKLPKSAQNGVNYPDSVAYYITQIETWRGHMAENEKDKIEAFKHRNDSTVNTFRGNKSFDAGTTITESMENSKSHGRNWSYNTSGYFYFSDVSGAAIQGLGFKASFEQRLGEHNDSTENTSTTDFTKFAYTLAEDGTHDALSVDVIESPKRWGPVFHTRGGQTSNPYEGVEYPKYYTGADATDKIHDGTMRIEAPRITTETPLVSNVPAGGVASLALRLTNESEIDATLTYKLKVVDGSNPLGAVLTIDGEVLTADGRSFRVPCGDGITKTLHIAQADQSILNYDNLCLVFASPNDNQCTDTLYVSAHFVPSSSPVTMHIAQPVINTETGSILRVEMSDFDRSYRGLKAFRVQYRYQGAPDWSIIKEYVLSEQHLTNNNELLPDGAPIAFEEDMKSYPDGTYEMRILSVSDYGYDEVTRESNVIEVVKDMGRPTPIGLAMPSDGILDPGDEISVTFNEDIRSGYITTADNFKIVGRLNGQQLSHDGVFQSVGGEGARTQASIDLSNRSFSFSHWLNWSQPGSIVRHGTTNNYLDMAVDAQGHLVIDISGERYTSQATLPKDNWCFVNVAYDYNNGSPRLTVDAVTSDNQSISLFDRQGVIKYIGNGSVVVGKGLTGAVHELTLYNYPRMMEEANAEKSVSKHAWTEGLMGYWRLDEGHGNVAEDAARSHHMTLPAGNNWRMAANNVALQLHGDAFAQFSMSAAVTTDDEDYLIEFWFRGEPADSEATLIDIDGDALRLAATSHGVTLTHQGITEEVTATDYLDNQWHHCAINVLRGTQGRAALYIDGQPLGQYDASLFDALATDHIILGARRLTDGTSAVYDQYFKGAFDELRCWRGSRTAAVIRDNAHSRVAADEAGLIAYYPFEQQTLDQFNQIVCGPDLADHSATHASAANVLRANGDAYDSVDDWSTMASPALKLAPELENVPFSFVASDRKIQIDLTADADRIEGSTISFTVKSVRDNAGNFSLPHTWTAYVKRNQLVWADSEVKVTKEVGEPASFTVDIANTSGQIVGWVLGNLPAWLTVNSESGNLLPLSQKALTFTVDAGTAIGRYEAMIALSGESGITSHLVVSLTVTGDAPDWTVDPGRYESSMTVVGQLKVRGMYSEDVEDMLAAFIDGECRGVAKPVYNQRYDSYFTLMTIYGNGADGSKPIQFRAFDASTGLVYPRVDVSQACIFGEDVMLGTFDAPVIFATSDDMEQAQTLETGWNWFSLYLTPTSPDIADVMASVADDALIVKSKTAYAQNVGGGQWRGDLSAMVPGVMYKIKTSAPAQFDLIGPLAPSQSTRVTVAPGWNWIGYVNNAYLSPAQAFADLNPQDGDVVKSRDAFAIYMGYEWVGSLTAMVPGQGYTYDSKAAHVKTFTYPATVLQSPFDAPRRSAPATRFAYDANKYQSNMVVVAQVVRGGVAIDCEVGVFDRDGECRGAASTMTDHSLLFLTVQGDEEGQTLHFRVVYGDGMYDVDAIETIGFAADTMLGTLDEPLVIDLDNVTGLGNVTVGDDDVPYYNVGGIRVDKTYKGVKISKDNKTLKR